MRWLALVVACGCGRVAFDPLGDSAVTDGAAADVSAADPDLVLHLMFDDDLLRDEVGHPISCAACPTSVAGRVGVGAAAFGGAQCLVTPDAAELRPAQFTLATWAKAGAAGVTRSITGKAFEGATGQENSYELFQAAGPDQWCAVAGQKIACTALETGTWHHVAATYEGIVLALYLDGAHVTTMNTAALQFAADPLRVGCDMDFGIVEAFFIGELDDLRLYRRVLTPAELAALAQ